MTSTPLTRDMHVDFDGAGAGPDLEPLLTPSRFDTPAYWYSLARTNAHSLALALAVVATSRPGDPYRADAIRSVRNMRREIALNIREAERLTR